MEETSCRTVSAGPLRSRWPAVWALVAILVGGCAGRYHGPRTLAGLGAAAVLGGSASWAGGEALDRNGHGGSAFVNAGFFSVAAGVAVIVAAGGWMAISVACKADPDCDEDEQCREIPAPPGGIPYKQCMSR
jgi:hypothetical protein